MNYSLPRGVMGAYINSIFKELRQIISFCRSSYMFLQYHGKIFIKLPMPFLLCILGNYLFLTSPILFIVMEIVPSSLLMISI